MAISDHPAGSAEGRHEGRQERRPGRPRRGAQPKQRPPACGLRSERGHQGGDLIRSDQIRSGTLPVTPRSLTQGQLARPSALPRLEATWNHPGLHTRRRTWAHGPGDLPGLNDHGRGHGSGCRCLTGAKPPGQGDGPRRCQADSLLVAPTERLRGRKDHPLGRSCRRGHEQGMDMAVVDAGSPRIQAGHHTPTNTVLACIQIHQQSEQGGCAIVGIQADRQGQLHQPSRVPCGTPPRKLWTTATPHRHQGSGMGLSRRPE